MDLSTTIIGLAMLGAFIIPIAILNATNKNSSKRLLSNLKKLAADNQRDLSAYDILPQCAIGISSSKEYIYFVRLASASAEPLQSCIPLKEVKKCWLQSTNHTVKMDKVSETVTDQIDLCFATSSELKDYVYPMYIAEGALQLEDEYTVANKWVSIINSAIAKSN
ncbi:hypothetical protein [Carboxylicivirga taeanensis]|uniref:hypothetical protein n=1 Tax=Carboxylicivirga taeanensis TaxID=1416875 RepID=UPI003F6E263B